MSRTVVAVAVALLAAGLLLPVEATADFLAGASAPQREDVVAGVRILKVVLAAHALLLALAARLAPRAGAFEPLVVSGIRAPAPGNARTTWALVGVLALASALRLYALGRGLSFDEIDTLVHYARKPLGTIATTFDSQNQHLLYSLLARASCRAFGESAVGVRIPAAVLGVASIWAVHRVALRVTVRREALFVAALLAVSYHHIWFSQNARGYTGLLLFTALGTERFLTLLSERTPRGFALPLQYGLCMALAALTHATAVIVVAAHGLIWLALLWSTRARAVGPNRWQPALGFVFAASLSLLAYALVLPQFFDTLLAPTMPGVATQWKDPAWLLSETLAGLARGVPGGMPVLVAGAALAALGAYSYLRQSTAVLATFVLGILLMASALLATRHNLWPRMFFFSTGFCVLIAVRGVVEGVHTVAQRTLRARASALATVVLMLACAGSAASLRHVWAPKQDFEGAFAFIEAERRAGDAVATVGMTTLPAELYGKKWPAVDNADALAALESLHTRTWIVYTTPTHMQVAFPDVWKRVHEHYREARVFWGTLAGCEVIVAVREE